jgi:hypothetical protein
MTMQLRPICNKFRLIRINQRSAACDPLEEFPKGNSLRRLQGALVFPRWMQGHDTIRERRWLFSRLLAQIAMASAHHARGASLLSARRYFSATGNSGPYV